MFEAPDPVPKKILVVEDSELLHKMYELVLTPYRNRGCTVHHVFDGEQALLWLVLNPDCDLIFLDLVMPRMGGLEFLDFIQENDLFWNIPIVIVTTRGTEVDLQRGRATRADGYLTKPIDSLHLKVLVQSLMAKRVG